MNPVIVVHGGAGAWRLDGERLQAAQAACVRAALAGQALLLAGGTALDAVESATRILEDDPVLDAGRGSYLNKAGIIEMDAMIMDGRTLALGAVGAIQRVANPVSLARVIMERTEHSLLVGDGASAFADHVGFPRCAQTDLEEPDEVARFTALRHKLDYETDIIFREEGALGDTVGAVALDRLGNLAAATSTGGTRAKLPGRVGDSPLVGSGAYADNQTAAASATGHGEALMKLVISKTACDLVGAGQNPQAAGDYVIAQLAARLQGKGGLILLDGAGTVGIAFNTDAMPSAWASGSDPVQPGR